MINKEKFKNKVILYVEDDDSIRESLASLFRKVFKEVHTASDGIEALDLLETISVDALITDLNMPNLNGVELIKTIRTDEEKTNKFLPIFVTSGHAEPDYLISLITCKLDHYALKPVNTTELLIKLGEIL